MLRATLKSLLARRLRLLLSSLAVVVGVAFVAGTFIFTDSVQRAFDGLVSESYGDTDVVVESAEPAEGSNDDPVPVPADLGDELAAVDGVAAVASDVSIQAQLVNPDGSLFTGGGIAFLGQNWIDEPGLNPYSISEGSAPAAPGDVVLDAGTASDGGFSVGQDVQVIAGGAPVEATVVGIARAGDEDNLGSGIAFFTPEQASELSEDPASVFGYRLLAEDGADADDIVERVSGELPAGVQALTAQAAADRVSEQVQSGLGIFNTILLVFAAVSVLVGAFLIFNTFSMLVAQRVRELALLRALGAGRGQVTNSVLLESVAIGLIGSLLGIVLGLAIALALRWLVGNLFGAELPSAGLVVAPRTILVALAVGLLTTIVAALLPARRASTVPPVAALRDAALPQTSGRRSLIVGTVLLVLGIALLVPGLGGNLQLLGLGALFIFLGAAAAAPLVARPVAGLIAAPFNRRVPGRLGRRNAMRNPRRTASTASALMVGVALVSGIGILGASLKASVTETVEGSFGADLVVQDRAQQGLAPEIGEELGDQPGVARVDGVLQDSATINETDSSVIALAEGAIGSTVSLERVDGELTQGRDSILLDSQVASEAGVSVGQQVTVSLANGDDRQLTVAGTYEENQLVGGGVVDASLAQDFSTPLAFAYLVKREDGADAAAVRSAVEGVVADLPNAELQDRSEFIEDQASTVDQITGVINALLFLSILIAVLGIVNTLALSVLERTRELGMLRAVGLDRSAMKRMVRVEAVTISVLGAVLGLAIGIPLGIAVQQALSDEGFQVLVVPFLTLLLALVGAAIAGVLASIPPARRAAGMNVLAAIKSE